jgi:hypothetical protein
MSRRAHAVNQFVVQHQDDEDVECLEAVLPGAVLDHDDRDAHQDRLATELSADTSTDW